MIRKESIGITNVMKILQSAQPVDWEYIRSLSPEEKTEWVNN